MIINLIFKTVNGLHLKTILGGLPSKLMYTIMFFNTQQKNKNKKKEEEKEKEKEKKRPIGNIAIVQLGLVKLYC